MLGADEQVELGPGRGVRRPSVPDVLDDVRVPAGAQSLAGAAGIDVEQMAAQEVEVPEVQRRFPMERPRLGGYQWQKCFQRKDNARG